MTCAYPATARIRKRAEFLRLQRSGIRRHTAHFVVILREGYGSTRLGITASKRVGNAVQRNRIKRLVRETFRRHRARILQPLDILVIAKPDSSLLSYDQVAKEFQASLARRDRR